MRRMRECEKLVYDRIITRRSTRRYISTAVEKEKLSLLVETGRYAPSGGNNQTNRFTVITSKAVLDKLANLVESAFSRMDYDENTYSSLRSSIVNAKAGGYCFHYHASVLIVISNRKAYGNAMADGACALENMAIMANAMDLGSCYINQLHWLDEDPVVRAYLAEIGIPEEETITCALAVGYPDSEDGKPLQTPLARKGNMINWVE